MLTVDIIRKRHYFRRLPFLRWQGRQLTVWSSSKNGVDQACIVYNPTNHLLPYSLIAIFPSSSICPPLYCILLTHISIFVSISFAFWLVLLLNMESSMVLIQPASQSFSTYLTTLRNFPSYPSRVFSLYYPVIETHFYLLLQAFNNGINLCFILVYLVWIAYQEYQGCVFLVIPSYEFGCAHQLFEEIRMWLTFWKWCDKHNFERFYCRIDRY